MTENEGYRFSANTDYFALNGIEIRGIKTFGFENGIRSKLMPVTLTECEEGAPVPPFMTLDKPSSVKLMDALWDAGVRPSNGVGSVGEIAAREYHLEDMRDLVASLMGRAFRKGDGL